MLTNKECGQLLNNFNKDSYLLDTEIQRIIEVIKDTVAFLDWIDGYDLAVWALQRERTILESVLLARKV